MKTPKKKAGARKRKPFKSHDRVILRDAPHLGPFTVIGDETNGRVNLVRLNDPVPVDEIQYSYWETNDNSVDESQDRREVLNAKLEELRGRLESVNRLDEITNCSAQFKLEKQIHDLERELAAEEWPDVIGGAQ